MIHPTASSHYEVYEEAIAAPRTLALAESVGVEQLSRATFRKFAAQAILGSKIVNARTEENFAGRLPPSPWSPNCVNSQEKSWWGSLYNVDPIQVPPGTNDPVALMKQVLKSAHVDNFNADNMKLVEERSHYLHYEYTVVIPSGVLKGVYIDDVDLFYNEEKGYFDIRSASRKGYRDAVHLDFSEPGANKKRVEAIRAAFSAALS